MNAIQILNLCLDEDTNELKSQKVDAVPGDPSETFFSVDQIFDLCFDSDTNELRVVIV